ncbi:hypothetical protein [Segatella salivae]|uniref:hypothetical protein n=1 Tax=Segatella salivae TaxID=228604 RepID=UPI0028D61B24|nr:hypothetical protein [Segatella salivae]
MFAKISFVNRRYHVYYDDLSIHVFGNINALMVQCRRCCAFDSPGLARNEPTLGKHPQGDSTP